MGTQVQFKNYLPGYYTMKDLNEDVNSTWPLYYEDRALNGQFYGGLTPGPVNSYPEYNKEVLKQTMLKHEATFRKQVYELHRLYRVQRDLMDELKRKQGCNYPVQVQASQSNSFSDPVLPKDTEIAWHMPHLPVMNSSCSGTAVSGISEMEPPSNFSKGSSMQASLTPKENGGSLMGSELLDSKLGKFHRRMLNLELPADAYIDCEDTEQRKEENILEPFYGSTDPINRNRGLKPENDVKLSLGTAENPHHTEESWKSDSRLQNGVADLNEPVKELCYEEAIAADTKFPNPVTYNEEPLGLKKPNISKSNNLSLPKDYFQGRLNGAGTWSVFLHGDKDEKKQEEWLFSSNDHGQARSHMNLFTSGFTDKNLSTASELFIDRPKKPQEFSLIFPPKQNETESWCREKPAHHIELSEKGSHLAKTNHSGLTVPTLGPLSVHPHSDHAMMTSPLVSSWRKSTSSISHTPVTVQVLPCFSRSALLNMQVRSSSTYLQSPDNACEKWQHNGDFRPRLSLGSKTSSYPNGFHHSSRAEFDTTSLAHLPSINFDKPDLNSCDNYAFEKVEGKGSQRHLKGLNSLDVKSKDMNLNLALPNGFHDGCFASLQNAVLSNLQGRKEHLSAGVPWLKSKPSTVESLNINKNVTQMELGFGQDYVQLKTNYDISAQGSDGKKEMGDSSLLDVLPNSSLVFQANRTQIQRNEASDTLHGKGILSFPILGKTQRSDISSSSILHQDFSATDAEDMVKDGCIQTDSTSHAKLLDLEKQTHIEMVLEKGVGDSINGFKDRINLNCSATSTDHAKSEISAKDELEVPSPISTQSVAIRFASEIDLEAPIISQEEEYISPADSSLGIDQLISPVEPQSKAEGSRATESLTETPVQVAAETIVAISIDTRRCVEDITCRPPAPVSAESLYWFADVVTSNSGDLENTLALVGGVGDGDQESLDVEGMDFFECMTLKLIETKVDEFSYGRPVERENPEEEETSFTNLLGTTPRRGQARRRRRQKRDFQKDILPGLASLARHEVTEDLQAFGGLMRGSGRYWQATGAARRRTGRNGSNYQARGRRRLRGTAATVVVEAAPVDPPPRQPSNNDLEIDGRSIVGWGRTTRRCRRQRCPPGNISGQPLS